MQEKRDSFRFRAYLVVSRVYEDEEEVLAGSSRAPSKQQMRPPGGRKVHPSSHLSSKEFAPMCGQQAGSLVGSSS